MGSKNKEKETHPANNGSKSDDILRSDVQPEIWHQKISSKEKSWIKPERKANTKKMQKQKEVGVEINLDLKEQLERIKS